MKGVKVDERQGEHNRCLTGSNVNNSQDTSDTASQIMKKLHIALEKPTKQALAISGVDRV
jgi:hypothetical protein